MNITNYESGEVLLEEGAQSLRLPREAANRLILMARMHTVPEFIDLLPSFIKNEDLLKSIKNKFEVTADSSERWNLKEKFARLTTLTKDYHSPNPEKVLEKVVLS